MTRLTARKVATAKAGKYSDGNGLYLIVSPSGSKKWVVRFTRRGKAREMGAGSASIVSLADARETAARTALALHEGRDPFAERKRAAGVPAFGEVAEDVLASVVAGCRNPKHRAQWRSTLTTYAASLWERSVDSVSTEDVCEVLKPIWTTKPETASRLRGRIEKVLDAAKAKGFRDGENPARWRGHLDHLLRKQSKLRRGHHAAMPYEQLPEFLADLRDRDALAATALELCILTAARTGEVLGMTWSEIDLNAEVWSVPAERMKAGRPHRVPLSRRAVAILRELEAVKRSEFVFPGHAPGKPLSNMAMDMVLRRMKLDVTVHGFRSSFRDWAGNETPFPREVVETALAHVIGDKAEQAYRRSDALEKRRNLMEAWAQHCTPSTGATVLPLRRQARVSAG